MSRLLEKRMINKLFNTLNKSVWITLRKANAPLALVGTSRKVPSIVIFTKHGTTKYSNKSEKSIGNLIDPWLKKQWVPSMMLLSGQAQQARNTMNKRERISTPARRMGAARQCVEDVWRTWLEVSGMKIFSTFSGFFYFLSAKNRCQFVTQDPWLNPSKVSIFDGPVLYNPQASTRQKPIVDQL